MTGRRVICLVNRCKYLCICTDRSKLIFVSYKNIGLAFDLLDDLTGKVTSVIRRRLADSAVCLCTDCLNGLFAADGHRLFRHL